MRAIRFRCPELPDTAELRWVFHRAFAPPSLAAPAVLDLAAIHGIASRFDMVPRIAARNGREVLLEELAAGAQAFVEGLHACAASGLRVEAAMRRVAAIATDLGIPLIVLKGFALRLTGCTLPGSRSFCDLDLLVANEDLKALRTAVQADGWRESELGGTEHQEAALKHPELGMVELHRAIPGVRLPGERRSVGASALLSRELALPCTGWPASVHVPARPILIAHALEHGLVQHMGAPHTYPLFRFLADLQDLRAQAQDLEEAGTFLRDLDSEDLRAVSIALDALGQGSAVDLPRGPSRGLLGHMVASYLDGDYALGLKSSLRSLRRPTDSIPALATLRSILDATFLSTRQVDIIYGPPASRGGSLVRRVLRPLDVLSKLGRSVWSRLRWRLGSRSRA